MVYQIQEVDLQILIIGSAKGGGGQTLRSSS
jgi:hypothetical protein